PDDDDRNRRAVAVLVEEEGAGTEQQDPQQHRRDAAVEGEADQFAVLAEERPALLGQRPTALDAFHITRFRQDRACASHPGPRSSPTRAGRARSPAGRRRPTLVRFGASFVSLAAARARRRRRSPSAAPSARRPGSTPVASGRSTPTAGHW